MFNLKLRQIGAVALIATTFVLTSCGDSSSNRSRNSATCAMGGECSVGDTGPSGGPVIEVNGTTYVEAAPAGWNGEGTDDPEWNGREVVDAIEAKTIAGTTGWSLPSMSQLGKLCNMATGAGTRSNLPCHGLSGVTAQPVGAGLVPKLYWTSQIVNMFNYYGLDLDSGTPMIWIGNGTADVHVRPIRQFSLAVIAETSTTLSPSTTEMATTTIPSSTTSTALANGVSGAVASNELFAPENVTYDVSDNAINFHWTNAPRGLASEGIFVLMYWEALGGSNAVIVGGSATSASTSIFSFMRGTRMTFSLRAYTNATRPSKIADTDEFVVNIPAAPVESTLPSAPVTTVPQDRETPVISQVLNPEEPLIEIGPAEVTQTVTPSEVIESIATIVPNIETVESVELNFGGDIWTTVNLEGSGTEIVIPAQAELAKVRITMKNDAVISQEKQIIRTVITEEDADALNKVTGDTSLPSTNSSESHMTLWIALVAALIAALLISVGLQKRKKA